MSFTNDEIKALLPGQTLRDVGSKASVPGLEVRARAGGLKSYLIYYRTKSGIQRRPKIGEFPQVTIGEARRRAQTLKDRASVGEDPKGDWDTSRAEKTVGDVYLLALEKHWHTERFVKSNRYVEVQWIWNKNLEKRFDKQKLSDMTPMFVRAWHSSMSKTPYAANRSMEVLSRIFTFAEEQGYAPVNTNPCHFVKANHEKKRKRYATEDEIQKIVKILEREKDNRPLAVAFLKLLLFTGSRPKALEDVTWEQLQVSEKDGQRFGVLIFEGKTTEETGEEETVILPPQAMAVIDQLPKRPGQTILGCKMPQRLWKSIKKEVGCTDLRARDFRRLFATVGLSSGFSLGTIGELLNHSSTQTTKGYAKLMLAARFTAVESIAKHLENVSQKEPAK